MVLVGLGLGSAILFPASAAQAAAPGTVVAWGCGGLGFDYMQCSVPNGLSGVTAIAANDSHSLALKGDGTVVAWGCIGGFGNKGQCDVPGGLSGVTAIAAGFSDSLALKGDGTVVAWGCAGSNGMWGQCVVPGGLSGVTAIAAGSYHSLALKGDGTIVAWGCGSGSDFGQCTPSGGALAGVAAISASVFNSLALKGDGTVVAWGCGTAFGGDSGDFGQCNVPSGLSGVTAIAAGNTHSLALKSDGTVVAWGCVGGSGVDVGQCSVPSGLAGVTAIAASQWHSLALKGDGTVVAWGCAGGTNFGQCSVPTGLCHVTTIAVGNAHNLALAQSCQTINFSPLASKTYREPDFDLRATASSGLPVSFAASGNCAVSGVTVHLTSAGSCTVTASQAGNVNYNPAPDVSQSFAIAKAGQTITFVGPLEDRRYGSPDFIITATASSGLRVSFTASGRCTVRSNLVHLTGVGRCVLTASQLGDANYNAAPDVSWGLSALPSIRCTVPRLVGKRIASARRAIASRHCRVGKVVHAYSGKRRKGIVISQSRRPGRVLPARSRINLIVSRGRRR